MAKGCCAVLLLLLLLAPVDAAPVSPVTVRYGLRDPNGGETLTRETSTFFSTDFSASLAVDRPAGHPGDAVALYVAGPIGSVHYANVHHVASPSTAGPSGGAHEWFSFPILGTPVEREIGAWSGVVVVNGRVVAPVSFRVEPGDPSAALSNGSVVASLNGLKNRALAAFVIGALELEQQDFPVARQTLMDAVRLDPNDVWAHLALAMLYWQIRQTGLSTGEASAARKAAVGTPLAEYVANLTTIVPELPQYLPPGPTR